MAKKGFRKVFLMTVILLAIISTGILTAEADSSESLKGKVPLLKPSAHIINCAPGEIVNIDITTTFDTTASVVHSYISPGGRWIKNEVTSSEKGISHHLKFTTPDTLSETSQFKLYISSSTKKETFFSVEISKTRDTERVARMNDEEKTKEISVFLSNVAQAMSMQGKKMTEMRQEIELTGEKLKRIISVSTQLQVELEVLVSKYKSETDPAAKTMLSAECERVYEQIGSEKKKYDSLIMTWDSRAREYKMMETEIIKIKKLCEEVYFEMRRGDLDRCVEILNSSEIAENLGWIP
jgi:hypothetical protein